MAHTVPGFSHRTKETRTGFYMPLTVLFVHGTGVRQPGYSDSFARAQSRVQSLGPDVQLEPCYWGGACGARFNANGLSVPNYDSTRGLGDEVEPDDLQVTLWEMLYRDPLFECRILRLSLPARSPFAQRIDQPMLGRVLRGLDEPQAIHVTTTLGEDSTRKRIDNAMRWLAYQPQFRSLIEAADEPKLYAATAARAIVARAIQSEESDDDDNGARNSPLPMETDARLRDRVVDELTVYIGENDRSFVGALFETVTGPIQGLALRGLSRLTASRRGKLMDGVSPAAGDVLLYQARGQAIRDFIRERIRTTGANVVLAHSLGGIACVDLLIEEPEISLKLLVTAGSQAPYFYEINALQSLPFDPVTKPGERLPTSFPRWLNIFDPRDFLSFVGGGIFGDRVIDWKVDNRLPFPQSHSGYWSNDSTWHAIRKALTEV